MSTQDEAAHLTPTERRLLEYLVRNAGRIVSHRELLEATSVEDIGTLRSHIWRLRKKIEIDPALPRVIITHHKLGYSFAGKEEARWFPGSIDFSGGIWHSGMNWLTILPGTRFVRL